MGCSEMFKRKKHKESDWFRGLKCAELTFGIGNEYVSLFTGTPEKDLTIEHQLATLDSLKDELTWNYSFHSEQFVSGMQDYINFKEGLIKGVKSCTKLT